jgi:hypothetical protein
MPKVSKEIREIFEVRRFGMECSPFPSAAKLAGFANAATDKESPILVAASQVRVFGSRSR